MIWHEEVGFSREYLDLCRRRNELNRAVPNPPFVTAQQLAHSWRWMAAEFNDRGYYVNAWQCWRKALALEGTHRPVDIEEIREWVAKERAACDHQWQGDHCMICRQERAA